jgi:hypothetical protein
MLGKCVQFHVNVETVNILNKTDLSVEGAHCKTECAPSDFLYLVALLSIFCPERVVAADLCFCET